MDRTSSKEFVEWMVFLKEERNEKEKQDYYLALIATEVRRSYLKDPRSVRLEDMLLDFGTATPKRPNDLSIEEQRKQRLMTSKSFWFALTGVKRVRNKSR